MSDAPKRCPNCGCLPRVDAPVTQTCRACGADLATGQGAFQAVARAEEPAGDRRRRRLRWRVLGALETLAGAGVVFLATFQYWFPGNATVVRIHLWGLILGLVLFGHGLLTCITGSFVSYAGSESADDREQ